jgi:predicted GNAT family acetyltransferase
MLACIMQVTWLDVAWVTGEEALLSHRLDRAAWHALTGPQSHLATRNGPAARFSPAHAPFAGTATDAPADLVELAALVPQGGALALFTVDELTFPAPLVCTRRATLHQMVLDTPLDMSSTEMRDLGPADVPAMIDLVALTHPGPFAARTLEMGRYRGIFRDGRLAAMIGERLRLDGFTEVSAVCTHPDFRGQRLAQTLIADATAVIFARGETPFLHVFTDNTGALAVYQRLGFAIRQTFHLGVVSCAAA